MRRVTHFAATALAALASLAALVSLAALPARAGDRGRERAADAAFYIAHHLEPADVLYDLAVVSDTSIWYTTTEGLFRFNGRTAEKRLDDSLFSKGLVESFLVEALSDEDVWVLGHDAGNWSKTMYRFDGRSWKKVSFPQSDVDPADDLVVHRFRLVRDNAGLYGVAVGEDGVYYYYDGSKWVLKQRFSKRTLRTAEILGRNDIWTAGRSGAVYHYDGRAWIETNVEERFKLPVDTTERRLAGPVTQPTGFDDYILEMSFSSPGEGWAVSTNHIIRISDGLWWTVPIPPGHEVRTVKAVTATDAWAFTDNSTILRWYGSSWHETGRIPLQTGYASVGILGDTSAGGYRFFIAAAGGIVSNTWGSIPALTNISASANIHLNGMNPVAADLDGDGSEDLFVPSDGRFPDRLYANRGDGFFNEMTDRLHPPGRSIASRAEIADLDNNGYADIIAHRGVAGDVWYKNKSGWRFDELGGPVGRPGASNYGKVGAADMNNDGAIDLVLMPAVDQRREEAFVVYLNDGVGRFTDSIAVTALLPEGASPGSFILADLDNDGRTDIFRHNYRGPSELYINRVGALEKITGLYGDEAPAGRLFVEEAAARGADAARFGSQPSITWAAAEDLDGNGTLDLFLTSRTGTGVALLNDGRGYFTPGDEITFDAQGENPAGALEDIDLDGDPDLFLYDRFYENKGGDFSDYRVLGFRGAGSPCFSDVDGDGDPDLFFSSLRESQALSVYENSARSEALLKLTVRGVRSNFYGIGSVVRIFAGAPPKGETGPAENAVMKKESLLAKAWVRSVKPMVFPLEPGGTYTVEVQFPSGITVRHELPAGGRGLGTGLTKLAIAEFSGASALWWDLYYSVRRSILMADMNREAQKLGVMLLVALGAVIFTVRKTGMRKKNAAAFAILLIIVYLVAVHGTIRNGTTLSSVSPVAGALIFAAAWSAAMIQLHRRRQAVHVSHYRLKGLIGEGGMGKVYEAADTTTGERVAVKLLAAGLVNEPENRKRLMAEGHLLSTLTHPNIVGVREVGDHLGKAFIAMEYLPGGTLRDRFNGGTGLPYSEIRRISLEVCSGLEEIHRHGVIHRDLKSGNLMFGEDGRVRIMDFGLSKSPLVTTMTTLGTILGTLGYVAPEQVTNISVDARADIFSLGVLLYEMTTGQLPFSGENEMAVIHSIFNVEPPVPSRLRDDVPAPLDRIIMKCIRKNPDERYASASALRVELEGNFW